MKRFSGWIFVLFFSVSLAASAGGWREKNARCRLRFEPGKTGEPTYLDIRVLSLPGTTEKGVRLFDSKGNPVAFHRYDAKHFLIAPRADNGVLDLYFDYSSPAGGKISVWPQNVRIPPNYKLRQKNIVRKFSYDPCLWTDFPVPERFSKFSQKRREYWNASGAVQSGFLHCSTEFFTARRNGKKETFPKQPESVHGYSGIIRTMRDLSAFHLENLMFRVFPGIHDGENASRIFFTRRPFDTDRDLITRFSGMLTVPETGVYEFKVNTNSTRIVRIDGKTLVRKFGMCQAENSYSVGTSDYFELKLESGVHPLEFIYYKGPIATWAALSWKRKNSEGGFNLMREDDFSPASPVRLLSCENVKGEKFPLVFRDDSLALFTAKHNPYSLDRYRVFPENMSFHWELDGRKIPSGASVFALEKSDVPELKIVPAKDSGYRTLKIVRPVRSGRRAPVEPGLFLKLWMPHFLYDDEYCDITLEIVSSLPLRYTALLETKADRKNPLSVSGVEPVCISSMPMEFEDRFACPRVVRKIYRLNAEEFEKSVRLDFSLSLPGLDCDRKKIRILPLSELPEKLTVTSAGLCDGDGCRLLPLIRRTTLHEIRAWELPREIGNEFRPEKRILVIGEDFGSFRSELERALKRDGIELDFLPWKKSADLTGSAALESIPSLVAGIRSSKADAAIVIPLSAPRRGTLDERENLNILAFLTELLREKESVRRIVLSTPLPLSPEKFNAMEPAETRFAENLRKLRREKGTRFSELSGRLRSSPLWTSGVYRENGGFSEAPSGMVCEVVKVLLSH